LRLAQLLKIDFAGQKQQNPTHAKTQLLAGLGKVTISIYF
jgi:hypothetical protein